jgi:hypothetical protein
MVSRTTTTLWLTVSLIVGPAIASATEPVSVFLKLPIEVREQENLEAVVRGLPVQRAKWATFSKSTLTYVVKQKSTGLLVPDPCEGLPIRVTIIKGAFQSAQYESSGGRCHKGQNAGRKSITGERLYLQPRELFQRIAEAKTQLDCYRQAEPRSCLPTTLRVTYDEKLGMPTKLEDYSELVSDYYWSLEITDIRLKP